LSLRHLTFGKVRGGDPRVLPRDCSLRLAMTLFIFCHREPAAGGRGDPVARPQTFHGIASSFTSFTPRNDNSGEITSLRSCSQRSLPSFQHFATLRLVPKTVNNFQFLISKLSEAKRRAKRTKFFKL